jgi:molybdopterin-guanine dinucleotide biosynthesis protein A
MRAPAYILAGGASRRFGGDKARAKTPDGEPQIVQLARSIEQASGPVTVVAARDDQYADLGLRTIGDLRPGLGPIGGLATALADHGPHSWLLLLACDWVGIDVAWVENLFHATHEGAHVVCYETERYEPLLTLYNGGVASAVDRQIRRGELAMHELLAGVPLRALPAPANWRGAKNMNRPNQ